MTEDARSRTRVADVYDEIADHFSSTRRHPWPEVVQFLETHGSTAERPDTVALDVGCGNGRHTELLAGPGRTVIGLDSSRGLLDIATERLADAPGSVSFLQADAGTLPLAADAVDVALYVATIHHLSDRESRVGSLGELARILRPDGVGLVSAWSTEHDRFDARESGFDTTLDWTLPDDETVKRFYHIYDPEEFEEDLQRSSLTVERLFVSSGNCYAIVVG